MLWLVSCLLKSLRITRTWEPEEPEQDADCLPSSVLLSVAKSTAMSNEQLHRTIHRWQIRTVAENTYKIRSNTYDNRITKAEIDNNVEFSKSKSEALREIGIQQKQAERYERLARVVNIPRCCLPKAWADAEPMLYMSYNLRLSSVRDTEWIIVVLLSATLRKVDSGDTESDQR